MNNQNPNKLIDQIARDMNTLVSQGVSRAHVCLWDKEIKLRDHNHTKHTHYILRLFSQHQLTNGLQTSAWTSLARQIAKILKGTEPCHAPQKPSQSKKPTPSLMP